MYCIKCWDFTNIKYQWCPLAHILQGKAWTLRPALFEQLGQRHLVASFFYFTTCPCLKQISTAQLAYKQLNNCFLAITNQSFLWWVWSPSSLIRMAKESCCNNDNDHHHHHDDNPDKIPILHLGFCLLVFIPTTVISFYQIITDNFHHLEYLSILWSSEVIWMQDSNWFSWPVALALETWDPSWVWYDELNDKGWTGLIGCMCASSV